MKHVNILMDDTDYEKIIGAKGEMTWLQYLMIGVKK